MNKMAVETKVINCGESGTTARHMMPVAATGISGLGIFEFTGEGRLPYRGFKGCVDTINELGMQGSFNAIAVPANKEYHMPIRVYVGDGAMGRLVEEVKSGKYDFLSELLENSLSKLLNLGYEIEWQKKI